MKFQQFVDVPKKGAGLEKSSWTTALLLRLSLISLLMTTACAPSLNERGGPGGLQPEILMSTEPGGPSADLSSLESLPFSNEPGTPSSEPGSRAKNSQDPQDFSERLRIVNGWLKFVRQEGVRTLLEDNSTREAGGEKLPDVTYSRLSSDLKTRFDASTLDWPQFKRWRQLVQTPKAESKSLDAVALLLTLSTSPDELQSIDQVLVKKVDQILVEPNNQVLIETGGPAGY